LNNDCNRIIKLMVTIVDRGKGEKVAEICRGHHLYYHILCFGMGTANSEMLDYLGLGKTEKDFVITMGPRERLPSTVKEIAQQMQLHKPGRGIVFTIPLSSISSLFSQMLLREEDNELDQNTGKQEGCGGSKYELVVAIVNRGYTDKIMSAARSVGAMGGTIIDGRGVGYEEAEKLLGVSIKAEKSIVCILCSRKDKHTIMQAINTEAGIKSEARGILLSVPVDDMMGLNVEHEDQAQ